MSLDVILAFVGVQPGKDDTSEQVVETDVESFRVHHTEQRDHEGISKGSGDYLWKQQ